MGQVKFYKDGNVWLYNEGIDSSVDKTVPPGNYRKSVIKTTISIRGKESTFRLFSPDYIEVTEIQKSATPDDNYADIAEFNTATDSFFSGQSTSLTDKDGKSIDVQNPLPTDGDSVYCKDLDLVNSDIGDFSGELCTLFDDYTSVNVAASVGGGGANPKSLTLIFKRPIASSTVGIGSPDTSISNAKLILIGLSGDPIKTIDLSADDTKKSVEIFQFEQKIFIGIQILFYTDDQVVLGGAGITKTQFVTIDAINGVISRDNSTEILLGADEVFTGDPIDTKNYGIVLVTILSDVISAIDGLSIEFSNNFDGPFYPSDTYSLEEDKVNVLKPFSVQTVLRWMRVVYTNGGTGQGVFLLTTQLKPVYIKPSSHRLADKLSGQDDAELVKAGLLGEDQNGIFQNVKTTEVGNLRIADFLVEVGRGNIPGYSFNRKFGQVDSVQASTPADIWEFGVTPGAEKYTFSTTDDIDTISGSNAGDTQDVIIEGLDINGDELIQTATLNGQNKVAITPLLRFNRAYNDNANDFLGNVYIYVNGTITNGVPNDVTTVRGFILAGKGQTNQSIFTVPNGQTAFLFGEEISLTKAGGATVVAGDFQEETRGFGKVFRNQEFFTLISSWNSSKNYNFPVPLEHIGRTDILPSVNVSANGVGASWAYTMLLIDD